MKLIIGGFAQGKLEYVLEQVAKELEKEHPETEDINRQCEDECLILDEQTVQDKELQELIPGGNQKVIIVNHLHLIIRSFEEQETAWQQIRHLIRKCEQNHQELILISDEVGNGIIPLSREDRDYRERVGRILCLLAKEADEVVRVICGLAQILK
ncbi:MAG: bifunctional adenosylcobinamide kinase/adenosylcobinamide-phosphate guanylyltransferase [Parasporobacterium sp.]|nr:bifunctional adenosylcobinamide kinase/adenosylcobinamide-phosphate guanylyltransferase [Parasporobacterium sp.]